ncbi:MAG: (2Fe-2S)-binding protein [Deltaproteobacteria bacterium]|nr:(2Fe-2S)-binding protein [Deltaproteobacteria bacterium]
MLIKFNLNGQDVEVETPPARRAVDLLREELNLTGTKEGCGAGECGACTIIVDGTTKLACLLLAAQLEGCRVTTIEGLEHENELTPLQEAFIAGGAIQCGFCTPGMVLTAQALLAKTPLPTEAEIRSAISGNLCRCTGYQKIVESIRLAAHRRAGELQ